VEALARYDRHRDELWPRPWTQSFFVSTRGNRPDKSDIERVFGKLRRQAGLEGPRGSPHPRLHDLRHYADGVVMRPVGLFGLVRVVPAVILSA
jgi:hypothetical protein